MASDSRTEILIVAGVAVVLFLLWHRNAPTAAGSTSYNLVPGGGAATNAGVPLGLTMPEGSEAGATFAPSMIDGPTYGGTSFNFASPGSCGCNSNVMGGPTYGSASDMAAGLIAGGYDMPFIAPGESY